MTLLVGGIGSLHDALLAAALRARGLDAHPLGAPGVDDLATGRALLARGHCNPTYHLAGAVVERARAAGAGDHVYLTAGSCGPCRFATYPLEYRRALNAAGLDAVRVVSLDPSRPAPSAALTAAGVTLDARLIAALTRAVVAADVLIRARATHRARADRDAVDAAVAGAADELTARAAGGRALGPALARLGAVLTALPTRPTPASLRVRITGQFYASITDGSGGHDLVRWLEARGAAVEPPAVAEWLLYLLWQARQEPLYGPLDALAGPQADRRTRRREAAVHQLYRRWAAAAAAVPAELPELDDLAALAGADYAPALRGGMGHLEVALVARAARDRSADLVVSMKPFGCLPSSSISDAVARPLARRAGLELVAVETTGSEDAAALSRLELALDRARSRAPGCAAGTLPRSGLRVGGGR